MFTIRVVDIEKWIGIPSYSELRKTDYDWTCIRQKILERDKYTCVYCGAKNPVMHVDHIFPKFVND